MQRLYNSSFVLIDVSTAILVLLVSDIHELFHKSVHLTNTTVHFCNKTLQSLEQTVSRLPLKSQVEVSGN
jgi:hypothetical protein